MHPSTSQNKWWLLIKPIKWIFLDEILQLGDKEKAPATSTNAFSFFDKMAHYRHIRYEEKKALKSSYLDIRL